MYYMYLCMLNFHNKSFLRSNNETNLASKVLGKPVPTHSISSGKKVRETLGLIGNYTT
jgi:hypothetical protein